MVQSPEPGSAIDVQVCRAVWLHFRGISSRLLVFNNLSKDWCWGRWPFQWYIIHHQCGLCPLQWWEWCGSMNIYSWSNVGVTRLVSRATHTHTCTHTRARALICEGRWHRCPAAVTSLTASIFVEMRQKPNADPEKGDQEKFNSFIKVMLNTNKLTNPSINQTINENRSKIVWNHKETRSTGEIQDNIWLFLISS